VLLTEAYIAQWRARQSLDTVVHVAPAARPQMPEARGTQTPRSLVRRGAAIAALSIPRVELSAVVLHGSDEQTLRQGPGHLEDTAMPGEAGNAVVAGHRDSFFRPLQHVRLGDDVFVDTAYNRLQYRVTSLQVVQPRDLSILAPTDVEVLTLITCYPFWLLGNAPDRFVVRAVRVGGTAAVGALVASTTPPIEPAADLFAQRAARPATRELAVAQRRPALDDDTLIRQAIERFRLTYNARLISRNDHRPGGLLEFRTCDVIIDGDQAAAHCGAGPESDDDGGLHVWTSTLQRAGDAWTIKQIVSPD
jgi:LPXTG-site transpeptidase (sortase) family protein